MIQNSELRDYLCPYCSYVGVQPLDVLFDCEGCGHVLLLLPDMASDRLMTIPIGDRDCMDVSSIQISDTVKAALAMSSQAILVGVVLPTIKHSDMSQADVIGTLLRLFLGATDQEGVFSRQLMSILSEHLFSVMVYLEAKKDGGLN